MTPETISNKGQENGLLGKILKRPCVHGPITTEDELEGKVVGFRNSLQMALALRKFGNMDDHSLMNSWLANHSSAFRSAFDKIIAGDGTDAGDPLFFDGYATIGDIPEEKWTRLEQEIERA